MTPLTILGKHPMIADNKGNKLYVSLESAKAAMEEYAQIRSIAFAEWIADNASDYVDAQNTFCKQIGSGNWLCHIDDKMYTTEELYKLFTQSFNQ